MFVIANPVYEILFRAKYVFYFSQTTENLWFCFCAFAVVFPSKRKYYLFPEAK